MMRAAHRIIALYLLLAVCHPLFAQPGPQNHTISTSGTATVRVKPDTVIVSFSVAKRALTVALVRSANVKSTADATAALDALKIPGTQTQTSSVAVRVMWRNYDQSLELQGYEMTNAFTVRIVNTDADQLAKFAARVVDAALAAGATGIDGVTFMKADDSALRRECMQQAFADARKNAEALAQAAGVKIRGVQTISFYADRGEYASAGPAPARGGYGSSPGMESSYSPGELPLRYTANATFEIEP